MEIPKTSSRTLNGYSRLKLFTARPEFDILKIAFFAVTVAALTRFLSYGINSELTDAFAWANIMKWTLTLALMFVSSVALIYFFVSLLRWRTRETTELKVKVVKAIHEALDQSSFNPHLNKQHERLNR